MKLYTMLPPAVHVQHDCIRRATNAMSDEQSEQLQTQLKHVKNVNMSSQYVKEVYESC